LAEGSKVELDRVLLVADGDKIEMGSPTVEGSKVIATAKGDGRAAKIIVFKYKNKVRYHRKNGHRQPFTTLSIDKIITAGSAAQESVKAPPVKRPRKKKVVEAVKDGS
jgi:ribosomal protein L21